MTTAVRAIKDELAKYPITYSFGTSKKHGFIEIDLPPGYQRRVSFSENGNLHSVMRTKAELRRVLRAAGIEQKPQRANGTLGEKMIEAVERVPAQADTEPETTMGQVTHLNGSRSETPAQPATDAKSRPPKSMLSNSEIVTVTRLICMNAAIDTDKRRLDYAKGWSDERILRVIQAQPGRGHLKLSSIQELRRREFGTLPNEMVRQPRSGVHTRQEIAGLHKRIDELLGRVEALEALLTDPRRT